MKNDRAIRPRVKALTLGIIVVILLITIIPRLSEVWQLTKHKHLLETQKTRLISRNNELKQEKNQLNSPAMIEKIAREQLGMVKNGERYVLPTVHQK